MRVTRRTFMHVALASAASLSAERALAQGIASHTAKPLARRAPSGRPFLSRFVDVAAVSGLTAPVVYGALEGQMYILEAIGCGCAFIDYDNDGWMDLFLLCGTRLEGDPEGRLFSEILVDVIAAEVIEPWGGGKWHMEIFRSVAPEPEDWNGEM